MSNFRFWVPLDTIEKATDEKTGKVVMRLGGIASTGRKDTDGEDLDPEGFDISYLKERGIVNWNHNKSPEAIIGEPTKAEITKKGLHIECELYPDSELANKVYQLATTLKKNSTKRRLGYSIEGKATLRDPLNPQSVKKAMITNVALTISPKNADSLVDIIKGDFHEWSDEELSKSNINPLEDFDMSANGGNTKYLVDITREDGTRILVDEEYRIKIDKALSTDSSSGQAITRESVEGAPLIVSGEGNPIEKKLLTKAEVIEEILESNSVISLEKANEIYLTLNNLAMSKTEITSELLEKALTQIGLKKSNTSSISKDGSDEDEVEESIDDEKEELVKPKDKLKKAEEEKEIKKAVDEAEEGLEDENKADEGREENLNKFGHHKAMAAHHDAEAEDEDNGEDQIAHHEKRAKYHNGEAKKVKKSLGALSEDDEDHLKDHHKKAGLDEAGKEVKSASKLSRYVDKNGEDEDGYKEPEEETEEEADDDGIKKAFIPSADFFKSLGVVLKTIYEKQEETNELIKAQNDLIKGQTDLINSQTEQIGELKEEIEKSNDAIEDLSNFQAKPKSVLRNSGKTVERTFEKGNVDELEKSNESIEKADPKRLSISKNKNEILNLLDDCAFEKGLDNEFAGALTLFESSGVMNQNIAARLKAEKGYTLVN